MNREYRTEFGRYSGDVYWTLPRVLLFLFVASAGFSALGIGACAIGLIGGTATNAAQVVQKEFYPDALLRKYEWFKDAAASLDKKQADMGVYDARLKTQREMFGQPKQWPRDVREQASIWMSEAAGIRASYNQLASEYNAEMAKFNWRFTNVGDVPQGGRPLPREYRHYQEQ